MVVISQEQLLEHHHTIKGLVAACSTVIALIQTFKHRSQHFPVNRSAHLDQPYFGHEYVAPTLMTQNSFAWLMPGFFWASSHSSGGCAAFFSAKLFHAAVGKSVKKFSVVCCSTWDKGICFRSAKNSPTCFTQPGSFILPRWGTGAK